MGVILYICLCGYPPFNGASEKAIFEKVKKGEYSFATAEWSVVSGEAKDLISKMLVPVERRISAEDILQHAWMKIRDVEEEESKKDEPTLLINFQQLKAFQTSGKFKKAVLTYIATQMNENEISTLRKLFEKLDKNGDGVLTFEELSVGIAGFNEQTAKEIQSVLSSIDTDKSGVIDYTGTPVILLYKITRVHRCNA